MADPTPGELLLQIQHLSTQLGSAVASLDRLSTTMERSYVRKDVYEAKHEALARKVTADIAEVSADVTELKSDAKDQAKHRRQTWTAIGLSFLAAFAGIIASILTGGTPA